jgi:hypothetical protein
MAIPPTESSPTDLQWMERACEGHNRHRVRFCRSERACRCTSPGNTSAGRRCRSWFGRNVDRNASEGEARLRWVRFLGMKGGKGFESRQILQNDRGGPSDGMSPVPASPPIPGHPNHSRKAGAVHGSVQDRSLWPTLSAVCDRLHDGPEARHRLGTNDQAAAHRGAVREGR